MNVSTSYRTWLWRRLALLMPSLVATVAVNAYLAVGGQTSLWIKATCLTLASILGLFLVYLIVQTIACAKLHRHLDLAEARMLRRQLRPYRAFTAASILLVASLLLVPNFFHRPRAPEPTVAISRSQPSILGYPASRRIPLDLPPWGEEAAVPPARVSLEPEPPARDLAVAPVEPQALALEEQPAEASRGGELAFTRQDPPAPDPELDRGMPRFRPELEALREIEFAKILRLGLNERPLPDEDDPDEWPSPELRLLGLFRSSLRTGNIAGLITVIDVPFGRDDSIQVSWLAAILPGSDAVGLERRDPSNWSHVSVEYVRRLVGYHSSATFDLAVSAGLSADFLKTLEGMGGMGVNPKIAPCVGLDVALWEKGAVGLVFHGGETFPIPNSGNSVGTTDISGTLRVDLSRGVSFHAGYRVIAFRFKRDSDGGNPPLGSGLSRDALSENLSGPQIGLDVRF